jgi:hypothetical protein
MSKVELAYPLEHDGTTHNPDTTIDLPDTYAAQLVREGRARWPNAPADSSAPAGGDAATTNTGRTTGGEE